MMFFGDGAYPKLGKLIRSEVANVKVQKPKVYEALVTIAEDRALVDKGLTPGQYPRIRIFRYEHSNGHPDRSIGGHHTSEEPGSEDYIFLSQIDVDNYLEHPIEKGGETPSYIYTKVLHEFVHWARFRAGKPATFHGMEAGHAFEDLAKGLDLNISRSGNKGVKGLGRTIRGHVLPHT